MKRAVFSAISIILSFALFTEVCFADGSVAASTSSPTLEVTADKYIIMEISSGDFLAGKNAQDKFPASHFTKLMTVLLVSDEIDKGKLSLDDTVTVSELANAQQGAQIWLDKGEKIAVSELLKAVTIGNANDACVALFQTLEQSEDKFVARMNKKARQLGMADTHYADATGLNENSVTTAQDTAILCAELSEKDYLIGYFTTWRDFVRGGKTELVNTNTLVKSYDGITGMKNCVSAKDINMTAVTATRGDMSLACVAVGSASDESCTDDAQNMLDYGFTAFEIYIPEIDKELLKSIKVTHGESEKVKVTVSKPLRVAIKRGTSADLTVSASRKKSIEAPFSKGRSVGTITVKNGKNTVLDSKIIVCCDVEKMGVRCAFTKLLKALFEL